MGRKRRMSLFVVTGNGNGLAGFGLGKAVEGKAALKAAKNRAGQRLMNINIYNNHTGTIKAENWILQILFIERLYLFIFTPFF